MARRQELNDYTKKSHNRFDFADASLESIAKSQNDQLNAADKSPNSRSNEEIENFRAEIIQHTRKIDGKNDVIGDFEEPQFEDDDLFASGQFVSNIVNKNTSVALGHGQSPRPNKLLGLDTQQNLVQIQAFEVGRLKDHDDDLSTIAETSEPSTPSVYSFQTDKSYDGSENSRTLGADDGTRASHDDSQSPTIVSQDVTPFNSMDDINLPRTFDSSSKAFPFATAEKQISKDDLLQRERNGDSQLLMSSSIVPGVSYTVLSADMSLEAAKAAGLPIIDNSSGPNDINVNSFDSAILGGKLGQNLKADERVNAPEGSQENEEFVLAGWERDALTGKLSSDPAPPLYKHTDEANDGGTNVNDFGFQEAKTFDAFQGDLASTSTSQGNASPQTKKRSFNHENIRKLSSEENCEYDVGPKDQSKAVTGEVSLSQQFTSYNEVTCLNLNASTVEAKILKIY